MKKIAFLLSTGFAAIIILAAKEPVTESSLESTLSNNTYSFKDTTRDRGKIVFQNHCNVCHKDTMNSLAPGISILNSMTPRSIYASLENGKMRVQGAVLSSHEKKAVAEWLTNTTLKNTTLPGDAYTPFHLSNQLSSSFNHSGWGNAVEGHGFRSAAQAGITEENVSRLKLKWAIALPDVNIMRAKPAIVENWLIFGSQYGDVYAVDRNSGKIGWTFAAGAAIRGAITVSQDGQKITAWFADYSGNAYAIDVRTGKEIWKTRVGIDALSSVTGSVVLYNNILYIPLSSLEVGSAVRGDYSCCISSGGVVAVNAGNGKIIWRYRLVPPATITGKKKNGSPTYGPSGAPVWCSPTVDKKRGLLYIGSGQNYSAPATTTSDAIQALDLKTGKVRWSFQATEKDMYNVACPFFENCPDRKSPDVDFGMAPLVMKTSAGKDILVVGQKAGIVYGINPDNGKVIWKTRVGKGGKLGGIHWGMATDQQLVYAAVADNAVAIDFSDSTIKASPGVYALRPDDGSIVWNTPPPCAQKSCMSFNSAAPLAVPGLVFAGTTDGKMRAYASATGKILWEYDSNISFGEIHGVKAHGGSIDGPPPVVADGMLFFNSGYAMFGQAPGNMLLAFAVAD